MFQFNSRLFLLFIVSRGLKKRINKIIIDNIRKSIIGIIFLIDIILANEIMIIKIDIINKSQKN